MLLFLLAVALQSAGGDWNRWLEEEVKYIISSREADDFRALATDAERERFVEDFWRRRDPDPSTAENEYREEHFRRIRYANERFNKEGRPGWMTERGKAYIIHGPPDAVNYSYGGVQKVAVQSPTRILNPLGESLPFVYVEFPTPESETWTYRHLPGAESTRTFFTVVFAKMDASELYTLRKFIAHARTVRGGQDANLASAQRLLMRDQMIKEFITKQHYLRNDFRVVYAGDPRFHGLEDFLKAVFDPFGPDLDEFTLNQAKADLARSPGDLLEEIWDRRREMEKLVSSRIFFGTLDVQAVYSFLKNPGGQVRIPFLAEVNIPEGKLPQEVDLLVDLVDRATGRAVAQLQDNIRRPSKESASSISYQSRLAAPPGSYRLRVIASDLASKRVGTWEQDIEVPDLSRRGFGASQLLVCDQVMPVREFNEARPDSSRWISSYGKEAPLAFDNFVFVPSMSARFRRGQELTTVVEVYNPTLAAEKPDVAVQAYFQRHGEPVLAVSAKTLDYMTGEGKTILYAFSLPLRQLDFGDYEFVVRLTDSPSGSVVERRAPLRIW